MKMNKLMKILGAMVLCIGMLTPIAANAAAVYMRGATAPWGQTTNEAAMDAVFGAGLWTNTTMAADPAGAATFVPANTVVFLDGSDRNALELNTYLGVNLPVIEAWVAAGGKLLLNSAPNQGANINFGFGGLTLTYPATSSIVDIVDPAGAIATTPNALPVTQFRGGSFGHAVVTDGLNPLTQLIVGAPADAQAGLTVLGELVSGSGLALFGGMTTDNFHLPQPDAHNLLINILTYLDTYAAPAAPAAPILAGGGGGCSLNTQAEFDPMLPLLALLALGFLYRRKSNG